VTTDSDLESSVVKYVLSDTRLCRARPCDSFRQKGRTLQRLFRVLNNGHISLESVILLPHLSQVIDPPSSDWSKSTNHIRIGEESVTQNLEKSIFREKIAKKQIC